MCTIQRKDRYILWLTFQYQILGQLSFFCVLKERKNASNGHKENTATRATISFLVVSSFHMNVDTENEQRGGGTMSTFQRLKNN